MTDKPIIVANWKATKTIRETANWAGQAKEKLANVSAAEVIVCPPFTSLPTLYSLFENSNLKVGAQDVSKFKKGAYTGEVTVEMLAGLAQYCIVGHSERRKYFGEIDSDVFQKVKNLLEASITPVLCVSDLKQLDSYLISGQLLIEEAEKIIFVYEPPAAISGGGEYHPEDPPVANENAGKISEKIGKEVAVLYGGSLNPENAASFFAQPAISGGLVGQASGDPTVFLDLISNAAKV